MKKGRREQGADEEIRGEADGGGCEQGGDDAARRERGDEAEYEDEKIDGAEGVGENDAGEGGAGEEEIADGAAFDGVVKEKDGEGEKEEGGDVWAFAVEAENLKAAGVPEAAGVVGDGGNEEGG